MKACPMCHEQIQDAAIKCRHCGEFLQKCTGCGNWISKRSVRCPTCDTAVESDQSSVQEKTAVPQPTVAPAKETAYKAQHPTQYRHKPAPPSYVGWAIVTWVLYYVGFWVIGFIANLILLSNAKRDGRIAGRSAPGTGCLWLLLFIHIILPIIFIVLLATGAFAGSVGLADYLDKLF